MNYKDEYYEDLLLDLDYLAWCREQELKAWHEYVSRKEVEKQIEDEAWNTIAEQYFNDLEQIGMILPSTIDDEESIEAEPAIETQL